MFLRTQGSFNGTKIKTVGMAAVALAGGVLSAGLMPYDAGAIDVEYREVFSDDFNRANISGTGIGNGWTLPGGQNCDGVVPNPEVGVTGWRIYGNVLYSAGGLCDGNSVGRSVNAWKSSPVLQEAYTIYNGKVVFNYDTSYATSGLGMSGILARYNPADGSGLFFGVNEDAATNDARGLYAMRLRENNFGDPNSMQVDLAKTTDTITGAALPAHSRFELKVQDEDWEFNIYDADTSSTAPLYSASGTSPSLSTLTGRVWGMQALSTTSAYDNFALYAANMPFAVVASGDVTRSGESVMYTISDSQDRTISNFSDGAGGTFSPASVQLNSANNYIATVTYTPARNGQRTVTADVSGGETFEDEVLVQPFSTKIGMLGDSITNISADYLVRGLTGVNVAVGGGRAAELAADAMNASGSTRWGAGLGTLNEGDPWRTMAIDKMLAEGVELVHVMLGTNDQGNSTPVQYKANMQIIIDALEAAGFKHVILSEIIWRGGSTATTAHARIAAFNAVLDELVAENAGFVLAGDRDGYEWFEEDNGAHMTDLLHPNAGLGQQTLAGFWTTAIIRNMKALTVDEGGVDEGGADEGTEGAPEVPKTGVMSVGADAAVVSGGVLSVGVALGMVLVKRRLFR